YNPGLIHWTIDSNGFCSGGDMGGSAVVSSPSFGGTARETAGRHLAALRFGFRERRFGFREPVFASGQWVRPIEYTLTAWMFPWWSVVILPTLLSFCLLVNKPRLARAPAPTQPTEPDDA